MRLYNDPMKCYAVLQEQIYLGFVLTFENENDAQLLLIQNETTQLIIISDTYLGNESMFSFYIAIVFLIISEMIFRIVCNSASYEHYIVIH